MTSRRDFLKLATIGTVSVALNSVIGCKDDTEPTAPKKPDENPQTPLPSAPSGLQVIATAFTLTIKWNAVTSDTNGNPIQNLKEYVIFKSRQPNTQFFSYATTTNTEYVDTPSRNEVWYYRVVARLMNQSESLPSQTSTGAQLINTFTLAQNQFPLIGENVFLNRFGELVQTSSFAEISIHREAEASFIALQMTCTHSGCGGLNLQNDIWTCRCHGSRFTESGNVIQGPAPEPLRRYLATIGTNGNLTITLG